MIIVAGHLRVRPADRDRFLTLSLPAIAAARATTGCLGFAVAADPVADDRVLVYERWQTGEQMQAFRGHGPTGDLEELIVHAEVAEFHVSPI
jgi:quinol monooxygenase YgiN